MYAILYSRKPLPGGLSSWLIILKEDEDVDYYDLDE